MTHNPDDKDDPTNKIRKCPHCGLIWIKVEGCDDVTQCGNRGWSAGIIDSFKSGTMKQFTAWIITFINGKAVCTKNTQI